MGAVAFSGLHLDETLDLTLSFQVFILTAITTIITILAAPVQLWRASQTEVPIRVSPLFWSKNICSVALVGLEFAALRACANAPEHNTKASLALASLASVASVTISLIITYTHLYSLRSSILASAYLSATLLFDFIESKSYFANDYLAEFTTLSKYTAGAKLALVILEEITKQDLVINEDIRLKIGRDAFSGFWNRALLTWMKRTIFDGYRSLSAYEDIPDLPPGFGAKELSSQFSRKWLAVSKRSPYALIYVCLRIYSWQACTIIIPRLFQSAFTILCPLYLKRAVAFAGDDNQSEDLRNGLVGTLILLFLGSVISQDIARRLQNKLSLKLRSVLTMELFKKSLLLTQESANESAAISLISTDVDSIVDGMTKVFDIFASSIQASVGIHLLIAFVDDAAWMAVAAAVCAALLSIAFGKLIIPVRMTMNEQMQTRVAKTSAALAQIKSLKMAGLAPTSSEYIQSLRIAELNTFRVMRFRHLFLNMSLVFVDIMTPIAVVCSALFSVVWNGHLSASLAFGTLLAVSLITHPLMTVMTGYSQLASIAACFFRIQAYLLAPEAIDQRTMSANRRRAGALTAPNLLDRHSHEMYASLSAVASNGSPQQFDIVLSSATVAPTSTARLLLFNLTMVFTRASFTMLLGPTGSGKTTFLRTLIGEAIISSGSVTFDYEQIAYCGQTAWIFNASIRDNITAGRPFDPVRYEVVAYACLLNEDFQQLPLGDRSPAGDNGSKLSGGQKQRVSLARALYVRALVLVLDDIMSALDPTTASILFSRVFGENGVIRRSSCTVFLATHSVDYIQAADQVVTIDRQGNITVRQGADRSNFTPEFLDELNTGDAAARNDGSLLQSSGTSMAVFPELGLAAPGSSTYFALGRFFFASVSKTLLFTWVFTLFLTCVSEIAGEVFLRLWFDIDPNNTAYYKVYVMAGLSSSITSGIQASLFYLTIIPTALEALHKTLIESVFGASLHFLTASTHASILNMLSKDISLVTLELPTSVFVVLYLSFFIIMKGAIIAFEMKLNLLVMLGLSVSFLLIAKFFLRISRQIRTLDLEARSPLVAEFTETASGLEHIRAFGWQSSALTRAFKALDHSQRPLYYKLDIERWLMLSLQLLTLILALSVVLAAFNSDKTISQPSFGLCLFLAVQFTSSLTGAIERFAGLETAFGAIARIRDFVATIPQESEPDEAEELPVDWPSEGEIVFANVTAQYNPMESARWVLNNISIRISAGETVGVIGRAGSGKSSMILTLLSFLEHSGSITIDGINISSVPHEVLRSRITTVPQEPVILPGTVRDNLMPYKGEQEEPTLHDGLIDDVLGQVHLLDYVNLRGGVDQPYSEMGFSHGQQQLLSIGRAMMHHMYRETKIILMDEPTSSMDNETDSIIQDLIRDEFIGATVMVITHRRDTIRDADMFLEFSGGSIVSVTAPPRRQREVSETPSTSGFSSSGWSGSTYTNSTASTSQYLWGHLQI